MKYKILIVEDDDIIASMIKNHLDAWDFDAKIISDFSKVYDEFIKFDPSLVLLDIGLPFFDGYKWCEDIRRVSKVPIIFISSMSHNMNIVMAMNMGGDDFIEKPFDLNVLTSKIHAILRRTYDYKTDHDLIECGEVILNLNDSSISYHDAKIDLTKNEFRIIKTLFDNKNKIVSRELLMQKLWETDLYIDDNTLTVNMTRLRKKLEEIGVYNFIITKKGQGYILNNEAID